MSQSINHLVSLMVKLVTCGTEQCRHLAATRWNYSFSHQKTIH